MKGKTHRLDPLNVYGRYDKGSKCVVISNDCEDCGATVDLRFLDMDEIAEMQRDANDHPDCYPKRKDFEEERV
jgi:hypothetical protein